MNELVRRALLCLLCLSSSLRTGYAEATEPVSALSSDEKAQAARLFKEALQDYDQGLVTVAIDKLQLAYAASPNPKVLYNLAQFQEAAGQRAAAFATFEEYLSLGSPLLPPGREQAVRSKLAELLRDLSKLKVETQPPDASLSLDGVPLFQSKVVDPGVHELVASAPGHQSLTLKVEAEPGASLHVVVSLPEEQRPQAPTAVAPPVADAQAGSSGKPRRINNPTRHDVTGGQGPRAQVWAPVVLGAGVALAAGAVASYIIRNDQESRWEAEDRRLNAIASEERDDNYWYARADNAERSRDIRRLEGLGLGLIVGASMLSAAGVGLWVTNPSNRRTSISGITYSSNW